MYCTQQNLVDRFGETELIQLTDRDNIGVIDTSVLARAITDAGCEMDSYLTGYSLPLATVPDNFERIACDIARYYLYDNLMAEQVKARYESCIRYLKDVSKGKLYYY